MAKDGRKGDRLPKGERQQALKIPGTGGMASRQEAVREASAPEPFLPADPIAYAWALYDLLAERQEEEGIVPVVPGDVAGNPTGWRGLLPKKPWEFPVTAVIPHCETPELLPPVIELLRLQTVAPYILVIDTGSTQETCELLELLRGPDLEIHYLRAHAYPHPSEAVGAAMDVAFALCRTEWMFATHADCFLRRRDYLEFLMRTAALNGAAAVGYQMSPRAEWTGNDEWRGMISHTASLFHMPTLLSHGISWSFERGYRQYGQNRDTPVWPDTETTFNLLLREHGLRVFLLGEEVNFTRQIDENLDHCRSYPGSKLVGHDYHEQAQLWMRDALREAWYRVFTWKAELGLLDWAPELEPGDGMEASRTPARRRPIPGRSRTHGKYFGQGKQFSDADSSWYFPVRTHALPSRKGTISRRYPDGSRDKPDDF